MPEPTRNELVAIEEEYADDLVNAASEDVDEWIDSVLADLSDEDY
jgi:hypothetical protein